MPTQALKRQHLKIRNLNILVVVRVVLLLEDVGVDVVMDVVVDVGADEVARLKLWLRTTSMPENLSLVTLMIRNLQI